MARMRQIESTEGERNGWFVLHVPIIPRFQALGEGLVPVPQLAGAKLKEMVVRRKGEGLTQWVSVPGNKRMLPSSAFGSK